MRGEWEAKRIGSWKTPVANPGGRKPHERPWRSGQEGFNRDSRVPVESGTRLFFCHILARRRSSRNNCCTILVIGDCSLVIGHWSSVVGQWSVVSGHFAGRSHPLP
jgi:hypothetical protein